jgi:hypothetical protein
MLPIGFYRPDLAETNPGVSLTVLNAILMADANGVAYRPHPSIAPLSSADALPDPPRGAASVVTRSGAYQVYVGTASKIYKIGADGSTTEIGSGYAVPSGDNWSITQFGDYVYFTNTFDGLVRYNIESGGTVDAVVGAPKARFIFTLFGTMAAADCDGNNRLLRTSKINDPTVWSGDASNTYQEFADGEELIAGGELSAGAAVVFQRSSIRLLNRTRDRSIFTVDPLALKVGAQSPQGCVFTQGWAYFVNKNGFHRTNGASFEPIGRDKVSRTFIRSLAANSLTTVEGAYDPENDRVIYRYQKSDNLSTTVFGDCLAVDCTTLEWVPIEMNTAALVTLASAGYSLDDLDQFGTLDTLPFPLDSRVWKGGEPGLAAIDGDYKVGYVSGSALACTLETGAQINSLVQRLRWATPLTDATTATVQLGVKNVISEDFTWKTAVALTESGRAKLKGRGKIFSLRLNVPAAATWGFMRGFDSIDVSSGGPKT